MGRGNLSTKLLFAPLLALLVFLTACGGGPPSVGWSRPVIGQGALYISSTGGKVYALDPVSGAKKWQYPADSNRIVAQTSSLYAAPVVCGDYVIAASSDKMLYVLKAATGEKHCTFETGDAIIATPAYDAGMVYVGSADVAPDLLRNPDLSRIPELFRPTPSKLYAVDLSQRDAKGQCVKKWEFQTQNRVWAEPLIIGDRLYVASLDHRLYALDRASGKKIWDFAAEGAIASSPKHADGIIYFGSFDTKVYAVNADTGKVAWSQPFSTGNWVWADPLIVGDLVIIGSLDRNVYALDAKTGRQKWVFSTGDGVRAAAAGREGVVFVGSEDRKVYALNVTNGSPVWEYNAVDKVLASPTLINGLVVVQNTNHRVIALDAATGQEKWKFETDK